MCEFVFRVQFATLEEVQASAANDTFTVVSGSARHVPTGGIADSSRVYVVGHIMQLCAYDCAS